MFEEFRRQPGEMHRILNFANRDLSVLKRHSETELMDVFEIVQTLLLKYNLKSPEFKKVLTFYLAEATHHFVHELSYFAFSPYDDLISYDCNAKYRAIGLTANEEAPGEDFKYVFLPGLHSFVNYSRLLNDNDSVGFGLDFDGEYEDPKMKLSTPLLNELHRVISSSSPASRSVRQMLSQKRSSIQAAKAAAVAAVAAVACHLLLLLSLLSGLRGPASFVAINFTPKPTSF